MDVSFTNVLVGTRQYFQGLPVPSTAGTTLSTENLATSTSSSYGHVDVTGSGNGPTSSTTISNVSAREASSNQQRVDSRTTEDPNNSNQVANSYWNPPGPVEPYAPQPTRVEVPDTRPNDGSCTSLEVPNGSLTEMQPANKHSSSTAELHQLQPPKSCNSPPPVYQQLNTVSRTPYSTATEMQSSYQSPPERPQPSSPMVAPRTQYYPRYHHPDITKSTPLPMTQSSTYQSANAVSGSGVVQQPATRSSPAEQGYSLPPGTGTQSRVHESSDLHRNHQSGYGPSSVSNGGGHQMHPVQNYTMRNALPTSTQQQQQQSSAPSPSNVNQSVNHQVAVHGNAHTHIPSAHNLPAHIPSPQNSSRVNPSPIQHHGGVGAGNLNGNTSGYCPRVSPHMPPLNSAYHSSSPHEASPRRPPSPHASNNSSTFQPHSPTYPPPPQPPQSTTHSYPASSSQHYQTSSYPSGGYQQAQTSGYHPSQKNPNTEGYYPQNNRSQTYAATQVSAPTTVSSGAYAGHGKSIAYNGVQDQSRRNCSDGAQPYGIQSYQTPAASQRMSNTHNLPPIAALSSYHYHRNSREALSKAQPMHRQQRPQSLISKNSSMAGLPPPIPPTRTSEYSVSAGNHPVNGNIVTSASSMYSSRAGGQPGAYPRYATTMAPSHHGSNATSTTATSNGAPIQTRSNPPTPVSSAIVHAGYPTNAGRNVNPYPLTPHAPVDSYTYKNYMNSSTAYPTSTVVSQSVPPPSSNSGSHQVNGTPNRKRESPLDLSLRTIKTPADSTAQDDPEASGGDKLVSSSNTSSRNSVPRTMMPPGATYTGYDGRSFGSSRSPASGVRASTPLQTVRAPKVDFLPNFSSTPHHHKVQSREPSYDNNNSLRRSTSQHLHTPSPRPTLTPLPNMSTFKRNPASSSPGYDKNSPYHPGNAMRPRYPTVVDPNGNAIPHQGYPADPNKYYVDRGKVSHQQPVYPRDQPPATKRPTPDTVYTGPSKQPRLDTWRLTIDQQIEQRLSTALHERQQRQELSLPTPGMNGVAPGANAGYQQPGHRDSTYNYCDKQSYSDPKGSRSSFASSSSGTYGNQGNARMAGYPHPPQPSGHQTSYPNSRQGQGQPLSYRVPNAGQSAEPPSNTGADKRVLSLLRNSLENKQHREEQLNNSQQPILANHNQQSFQNKVVAPVEPKTNIGRHNLSPFTAASLLERNSTTPPHYKFHVPRAVDSIIQEPSRSLYGSRVNSSATIPGKEANSMPRGIENQILRDKDDGLAAILAARIRTKAELKQVGAGQFGAKSTVASSQEISVTPRDIENGASTSTPQTGSSGGSPPKLTREQAAGLPPRRRLFSKTEEDLPVPATIPAPAPAPAKASMVPLRASEFRSSSETSVFDFRESDSEGEMPVLERQTLEEMRRDRKQLSKVQPPVPLNNAMYIGMASSSDLVKIELKENDRINEPDSFWSSTCDKFMEQLRSGDLATKKRGRRKKAESGSLSITKSDPDSAMNTDTESALQVEMKPEGIKQELLSLPEDVKIKEEVVDVKTEDDCIEDLQIKTELIESEVDTEEVEKIIERDSDELPLIQRATRKKSTKVDSDCEEEIVGRKKRIRRGSRIKLESSSGSESSSDESDASTEFGHGSSVADRLRARKRSNTQPETEGMKLRSRDTTPHKASKDKEGKSSPSKGGISQKAKPKPLFGDGSDFRPGWEDEVYVYKKSLRMPTRLITVSKPSRFHRLSTSLPDLDPGSPALSVSMDSTDICLGRKRISDSDLESNCSFSVAGLESKIDDEEATSSTTMSCPIKTTRQTRSESNSIVDLLAQRVGTSKKDQKRKAKEKLDRGPKVLPKGSNEPELLATPSLTPLLSSEATATPQKTKGKTPVKINKSPKPIKVMDSFLLGYFRKETVNNFRDVFKNNLPNEFSTFVLKSRTRTETRVLKKQATIREVFGEDRPASAPPMQTHGDTSQDDDDSQNETQETTPGKTRTLKQKVVSRLKSAGILRSNKAIIKSKLHLLNPKKRNNLLKSLAKKKLRRIKKEEVPEEDGQVELQSSGIHGTENKEPELADETEVPSKKRLKLRTGRRKFRSGFDYIRKKKKPLKKDDALSKERKRQSVPRPSPESVADIQTEIRTWVIKKGVGETILHRAARLGYTDVAAYCLEKLDSAPSPKDNAGYTPLHEACSRGHLEIAKLLLAYGANVSESANGGIRPLHEAAENGATELVRLLLSYGADPLLATYAGQTPLMLASDTDAYLILEQHLDDIQGRPTAPWSFGGPSNIFDLQESGYSSLSDPPMDIPEPELDDIEMEVSDVNLPVLYSLANDPDKWVLLQDLTAALRVKSRDALLRQVNPKAPSGPPAVAHRDIMRELKLPDFLEQSRCCHLLSGGERINVRASKVTLIKYNEKVKSLLNVERIVISSR